jgi:hypothetical protein
MNGQDRPPGRTRPSGSAIDIRALLTHREYIKTTAYVLPRRTKIQVLEMMERLRQERVHRRKGASVRPDPLPEMTGAELVREINWRIGTLPPKDAEAIAGYIRRLTRWRAARTRKGGGRGGPSAPAAREASR